MKRSLLFASALFGLFLASSCSSDTTKLEGVVTLDGKPVEGATVTFMTEDAKSTYGAITDANGNFTLVGSNQKQNVANGTYKVTVVKYPAEGAGGPLDPSSPDAMKMMKKETSAAGVGNPVAGKGGPMMPGMPGFKGGASGRAKSMLPEKYATMASTPITVKIPPPTQPVPIELSSK